MEVWMQTTWITHDWNETVVRLVVSGTVQVGALVMGSATRAAAEPGTHVLIYASITAPLKQLTH